MNGKTSALGSRRSVLGVLRIAERRVPRAALVVAMCLSLAACDWFTDFKRQPKIDPWEAYSHDSVPLFRGNPQGSVPMTGTFMPGYVVSYSPAVPTIDSMASIANPTAPSPASLANGKKYWQINCAVCHGMSGAGNGPATRYGVASISLLMDITKNRTDGYIFGMIRNGRNLMPPYNRIEEMDRWDVVNYLRGLQGKLPAPVDTMPIGRPGETGQHLPGPTRLGPTKPVPYYNPARSAERSVAPPAALSTPTDSIRPDTSRADTTRRPSAPRPARPRGDL